MHLAEIRENTEKNFGSFTKMLRVETDLKAVEKAEKDYNTFFESIDKLLNTKRATLRDACQKLETKLKDWGFLKSWLGIIIVLILGQTEYLVGIMTIRKTIL